ncbi:hypothetical protein [Congregibacter sp.]|uniref:hypothetical protein n=1 Tax=Congregibacter sp. TaxID=2744308 RepID=UPI003F6AACB9
MLTESAYITALILYTLSAVIAVVLMNVWLLRSRSLAVKLVVSLPVLAFLLTPALIQPEADTFAPALIVLAFQWLSLGKEAAEHALRPLLLFTGLSFGLGLILALVALFRSRGSSRDPGDPPGSA